MIDRFRNQYAWLLIQGRRIARGFGFWLRALMGLAVGLAFLFIESRPRYDLRLQVRPPQPISSDIVIITISEKEWQEQFAENHNLIRPLKEITSLTDGFFWHEEVWAKIVNLILARDPRALGVCLYFGENLTNIDVNKRNFDLFHDERIVWSANLDNSDRVLMPKFGTIYGSNAGVAEIRPEPDGVFRSLGHSSIQLMHFTQRLARLYSREDSEDLYWGRKERQVINFQGPAKTFRHFTLTDLLRGGVPKEVITDKLVLIGLDDVEGHRLLTPVGMMSKAEVFANAIENILHRKWISLAPDWVCILFLFCLQIILVLVINRYSQTASLVFFFITGMVCVGISAWIFDTRFIWFPAQAPLAELCATYVLFLSYQLTQKEKFAWQLEQERRARTEIEQLKHNFVGLISHDLKTPIARIQAVVDRLLAELPTSQTPTQATPDMRSDLISIRSSSQDLHRYIQSILQMTKVESRAFRLHKVVTDINEIIEKAAEQVRPLARIKNIDLQLKLEPIFSTELDVTLVLEVIMNLLENAIKYTQDGGLVIVTSSEINDKVKVTVADNGVGIEADELGRVFEKFYRGRRHSLTTRGSGLGLYLVKYFIELHGGEVFCESTLGSGTRIGFSLPLETEVNT